MTIIFNSLVGKSKPKTNHIQYFGGYKMNYTKLCIIILLFGLGTTFAQNNSGNDNTKDSESNNITQYYGGKFGFYNPSEGLNNGLLFGIDGITEFNHYNFFLSGAADLYFKKTFDIFTNPHPSSISDQQMILIPLHINFGYKLLNIPDANTRFYAGVGGGYYLYFFGATTSSGSGGLLGGGGITNSSANKSGGAVFGTVFFRAVIGKIFVEPRYYFAGKVSDSINGNPYTVNPSGFAITLGFQY